MRKWRDWRTLSMEERRKGWAMYKEGYTRSEIGEKYGLRLRDVGSAIFYWAPLKARKTVTNDVE